jgi:hypothetical protein
VIFDSPRGRSGRFIPSRLGACQCHLNLVQDELAASEIETSVRINLGSLRAEASTAASAAVVTLPMLRLDDS